MSDVSEKVCCDCLAALPTSDFYSRGKGKGFFPRCKACHNTRTNAWRKANPDKVKEIHVRSRRNNADKVRLWEKRYRENNPDKRAALMTAYYQANGEEIREAQRLRRLADLERYREKGRLFRKRFPIHHRLAEARRRALKHASGGEITAADWASILAYFSHACAYCLTPSDDLTLDHIDPLSKGGPHVPDNAVPACRPCNSRKSNRKLIFAAGVLT